MANCLATRAGRWRGRTVMLVITRTRSVSAAAAAVVTTSSGLWNVIRSPAETLEYGPSSIPRHHSTKVALVNPAAMVGSAIPISMARDPSEGPGCRMASALQRRCVAALPE